MPKILARTRNEQNAHLGFVAEVLAAAPTSPAPVAGRVYFDSTIGLLRFFNGTAWVNSGGSTGGNANRLATTITGNGTATDFVVTHNANTRNVGVFVREAATPFEAVIVDDEATTVNTVTLRFGVAPANGVVFNVTVLW